MKRALTSLALLLSYAGCDEDDSSGRGERPPLPPAELPLLRCAAPLEPAGACARDEDCGSERCVLPVSALPRDRDPVALQCGPAQGTKAARERCLEGRECESGLCGLAGVCMQPCAEHGDCVPGQFCQPVEIRVGDAGLAPVMACARNIALPADVAFRNAEPSEMLRAERLNTLDVPGFEGTALVYLRPDCGDEAQVWSLRQRDDARELFDIDALLAGRSTLNPISNQGGIVPILLPNNPSLAASRRGYELDVVVDGDTRAEVVVASRSGSGKVLDFNIFYLGAGEDEREGGFHPGEPRIGLLLGELAERYADIGITFGAVREYDVVGALREELSVLETELSYDDDGNLVALDIPGLNPVLELSAGLDDGGINLFLVREMGDVLGVSGGIPGSLGVHGTPASGVVLALDVTGFEFAPNVLMHEMSHQMGLFHTTEFDGSAVEPLEDTPVCPATRDLNGDGVVSVAECRGRGADNLMFWGGSGWTLSPQQIQVLRRALVLR